MSTFRVAVLGTQDENADISRSGYFEFGVQFGVQAFDLTVDQICQLLTSDDLTSAIDATKLGAQPLMTYKTYAGGRFFPTVSREELSQVMQGVEIFVVIVLENRLYFSWPGREFMDSMMADNLLDKCRYVVVRIVDNPEQRKRMGRNALKKQSIDELVQNRGIDLKVFKDKSCIVADNSSYFKHSEMFAKKAKAKGEEVQSLERDIANLRLKLVGEEVCEAVTGPVKETVTAGKSFLGLGQRLVGWIGGMVRAH